MATALTLIRGGLRFGEVEGLPAKTESCRCLPPFAQCAAVSTLVGAIGDPVQISLRFCSSTPANGQPSALALPPPTILGATPPAPAAAEAPATEARQRIAA